MADTKKYLSLERLQEYDALIKEEIAASVSGKANASHSHAITDVTNLQATLDAKATQSSLDTHTNNGDIHVTSANKTNWNNAYTHSTSAHAPTNAEKNIIVGIQKNGTDLTVDSSTRKVNITVPTTAAEIGAATSGHNHDNAYDKKGAADSALASAKTYADTAAATVKNDLLNNAGAAYDTLKELGDLIVDNADAIDALETIASGKADKATTLSGYGITDAYTKTEVNTALDGKANASHGTHVTFDSTNKPKMDGTAAFGTSTNVARADHIHPTDTSRASQVDLDTHATNTTVHITSTERTNWNAAKTHADTAHAPSDAQANVIESIKVNGTAQTISNKSINITVPTDNASLTNGAGYLVASDIANKANKSTTLSGYGITDAYTKSQVDAKTVVDSTLSSTSTNSVQNKVVNSAITTLTSAVTANTNSISTHSTAISSLQEIVGGIQEITSAEIQALFAS